MIDGRIIALDGGGLARLCPFCDVLVEDDVTDEVVYTVDIDGEKVPSLNAEIGDKRWRAHLRSKEHRDAERSSGEAAGSPRIERIGA